MFDPASAGPEEKDCMMSDLMQRRARLEDAIEVAEESWMAASEALEQLDPA